MLNKKGLEDSQNDFIIHRMKSAVYININEVLPLIIIINEAVNTKTQNTYL